MFIGIDTGGTFTDFVVIDQQQVKVHKILSTPQAPEIAIVQGLEQIGLLEAVQQGQAKIVHGSTVATNAALENKGVSTVYITNQGHGDMLSIGRQQRPQLYALQVRKVKPPVPKSHCLELNVRVDAQGRVLVAPKPSDIDRLLAQIQHLAPEAVAINFLFSYLQPEHEQQLEQKIRQKFPTIFISCSSSVLTEIKEYERGIATWLNAYVGPVIQGYLSRLAKRLYPASIAVMHSGGGTMNINQATDRAVELLLSGPAGGLAGAQYYGRLSGQERILSFDMGGTSTDVAMLDGEIRLTREGQIGPYPIAVPMVDMHTIGAGGGSIAYIDAGGLLQVGPESAGAYPGPACYGNGGKSACVTDANLVLGRLGENPLLGGKMALEQSPALQAIAELAEQLNMDIAATCHGIIDLANQHMAQALRVISVQQGVDPKDFSLCCFGGAGGLHVCALADELDVDNILIPIYGGVLSAFGMLVAPPQRQRTQTVKQSWQNVELTGLWRQLRHLAQPAIDELQAEFKVTKITCHFSLDLQYQGQSFQLSVDITPSSTLEQIKSAFKQQHLMRYGHNLHQDLELVNLKITARFSTAPINLSKWTVHNDGAAAEACVEGYGEEVAHYQWQSLSIAQRLCGPCIVSSDTSTLWVAAGWHGKLDDWGNISLRKTKL